MSPIPGVCWLFQAGQCPFPDTHRGEDGSPQFHVCQPCFQVRHELIEHTCRSSHPGHCNKKPYGAIACPLGTNSSPNAPPQSTCQPTVGKSSVSFHPGSPPVTTQLDFGFLNHKPSFKCDCQSCGSYFEDLQLELSSYNIELNIESLWNNIHFPTYEDQDSDGSYCHCCGTFTVYLSAGLCHECDVEDFERAWQEKYGNNSEYDDDEYHHW